MNVVKNRILIHGRQPDTVFVELQCKNRISNLTDLTDVVFDECGSCFVKYDATSDGYDVTLKYTCYRR